MTQRASILFAVTVKSVFTLASAGVLALLPVISR